MPHVAYNTNKQEKQVIICNNEEILPFGIQHQTGLMLGYQRAFWTVKKRIFLIVKRFPIM